MGRFGLDWEKHNLLNRIEETEIEDIAEEEVFTQDMPVDISLENKTVSLTPDTVLDEVEVTNLGEVVSDDDNGL